jgi:RNA-directed DNA polymerase
MSDRRQKNQLYLAFAAEGRGEAPKAGDEGTESLAAKRSREGPATGESLMEEICERENGRQALARVQANRGRPGVDGMTVHALPGYLQEHWATIRDQLVRGTYVPQPVKRVEIPKPDGGVRKLGIPTVLDRLIQQAVLQVLQRQWDRTFSEHSYGFRPGRSAHQAVAQAQQYIAGGYRWVVDLDLEKFFDRVHHDRLMARLAQRIRDKRLLKLIRAFLTAGVLEDGLVRPVDEGAPQGGPLSPLLSNIVLDEFDRELERRGLRFARYLTTKLKLQVNAQKSAVARPWERKFLGFRFTAGREPKRRIASKALGRFQERVRELTRRTRGVSIERMAGDLTRYLRGWLGYFGRCQTPSVLAGLEAWLRRRLRSALWKQWKRGTVRFAELRQRGVSKDLAAQTAGSAHGPWPLANSPALAIALPNAYFDSLGIPRLTIRP